MADRVKLVERIAARGRRKMEKLALQRAIAEERAVRDARPVYIEDAKYLAKRDAAIAEFERVNARRADRTARRLAKEAVVAQRVARVLTPQELTLREVRRVKRAEREVYREALARERLASLPAPLGKRLDAVHSKPREAAKRAIAVLRRAEAARNAKRLPPLPYSSVPPLPY